MLSEDMAIEVLDVLRYRPKDGKIVTAPRSFCALSFRLRGKSKLVSDNGTVHAATDDIVFTPAHIGWQHFAENEDIIVIHFRLYNCVAQTLSVLRPDDPTVYRRAFEQILSVWNEKKTGYKFEVTALVYRILATLQKEGRLLSPDDDPTISESIRYIKAHLSDNALSVSSLARKALMSEAYYRRRFAEAAGVSPKEFITALRMEYAVSLLGTGYYSHKEICQRCGFSDVKYFREAFRRHTGTPLSKYTYKF